MKITKSDLRDGIYYDGTLICNENLKIDCDIIITGYLDCRGDLVCGGNLVCRGNLDCGGYLICQGNLDCRGNLVCGGYLNCRGYLICQGYLNCGGLLTIKSKLVVKYLQLGKIGSRNSDSIFYITEDEVFCKVGCFEGSMGELEKAIADKHNVDSIYFKEYMETIKYVKALSLLYV